jgi:hypothetical protein
MSTQVTLPADGLRPSLSRVSWGAILSGVAVALVAQLLLNMLGVGIGAATIDPATSGTPEAGSFSIGAAIWWTISGILASFAGAYVAGRLAGHTRPSTGSWHGLTTWAVTTLLIVYLLTSAVGSLVGGAFSALGSAAGGLGRTAGGAVQTAAQAAGPSLAGVSNPFSRIEQSVRQATAGQDPAAARDAAVSALQAAPTGDQGQAAAARDRAADALAKAQGIPVDQAKPQVAQYEQQYRQTVDQAKQQAIAAADATAKGVSRAALFGFIALLLGGVSAWYGGRSGVLRHNRDAASYDRV